ncbi:MAG: hypothetical protein IT376_10605, partial [Polyangiaceae bacterium]|nr:hypothetical protein [Polyangiaceae bacterium]
MASTSHPRDALGRIARRVDEQAGRVTTWEYEYDARGRLARVLQPLRWQGRWLREGGLYDARARWWSPALGSFTSADELGYVSGARTLWSWPGQNALGVGDMSGRVAMRSDDAYGWATSGNFGFGLMMFARGQEQRRAGLLDAASTGGGSLGSAACGAAAMGAAGGMIGAEGSVAVGAAAAVGALGAVVARGAGGGAGQAFKSFTQRNFRANPGRLTGSIPEGAQAHHVLPAKFEAQFGRARINIHDPRFGAWWEAGAHGRAVSAYNAAWESFLTSNPSPEQIPQFGRDVSARYGLGVGF